MSGYQQQFCPIARASEIFAERWTPIIVRNLLLGCQTFNELVEGAPGIPRSLLSARLRTLHARGIVRRTPAANGRGWQYALTPAGHELQTVCDALGTWGARWLDIDPDDLDPGALLWAIGRALDVTRLPTYRLVVRIALSDHPRLTSWWLLEPQGVELGHKPPDHREDLVLRAETVWLARWHAGLTSLATARREGHIVIEGPPRLARAFTALGGMGRFADVRPVRNTTA